MSARGRRFEYVYITSLTSGLCANGVCSATPHIEYLIKICREPPPLLQTPTPQAGLVRVRQTQSHQYHTNLLNHHKVAYHPSTPRMQSMTSSSFQKIHLPGIPPIYLSAK